MVQTTGTENGHRKPRAPEQKTIREHGRPEKLSDAPHTPQGKTRGRRERTDATLSEPGMPQSGWPAQPGHHVLSVKSAVSVQHHLVLLSPQNLTVEGRTGGHVL